MASNTANHLSLEYKTENELKFAQWAMREYGMTNKERTTHTFKGQMSVLLEVWNVVDMITLPISLVSAGGKFIGKEVAKEVGEELGEKAVKEVAKEAVEKTVKREVAEEAIKNPVKREVAEEAIEKTVKTEVSEEIAKSAAKKEMADTAEGLSQKPINKNDALENSGVLESGNKSPSEIAKSWQGSGKYPGIDDYVDVIVEKGTILYRGEPNGTEYFTTLDAIEQSGRDATKVFEGLQVEKNPIHGYRGEMRGYLFNDDIASAYGITNANPQFGKGGLPQYYVPNVQDLIDKGILIPVDSIKLYK